AGAVPRSDGLRQSPRSRRALRPRPRAGDVQGARSVRPERLRRRAARAAVAVDQHSARPVHAHELRAGARRASGILHAKVLPVSELLSCPPYGLRDEGLLLRELNALTSHHRAGCEEYARIWPGHDEATAMEDVPYLHVGLFKHLELRSSAPDIKHERA